MFIKTIAYFLARFRVQRGESVVQGLDGKTVGVLANGPHMLHDLSSHNAVTRDLYVSVNDAPNCEAFFMLKPSYHFVIDPFFFKKHELRVREIVLNLNRADWPIKIVVPQHYLAVAKSIYPNHTLVGIPLNELCGQSILERTMFKHRLGMPRAQNVLVAVLSFLLWNGVSRIYLYGASHDWVRYMVLVDGNLHLRPHHYFDNVSENVQSKPWVDAKGRNFKVSEVLIKQGQMFASYEWLLRYMRKEKTTTRIINLSKETLIDSFDLLQEQ